MNINSFIPFLFAVLFSQSVFGAAKKSDIITIQYLASPAPPGSSLSRVVSDELGDVYLSWVSQDGQLARLSYSKIAADSWSDATIVSEGNDWFINWADFPMLSIQGGKIAAHWLRMSAEGAYDYNIEASFYAPDENNWSEARVIHSDGVNAEHGFVSMLPMDESKTLISWLDGRNTKLNDGYGEMSLRAGLFDSAGKTVDEWELDHRVCDCCQTSSAMTAKGPIVVYRDRSDIEVRDISIVRYINAEWTVPRSIHHDNWKILGCPVNGPSVAADDNRVAIAWFTAKDDVPKVLLALSNDAGDTFSSPITVASPNTIGRVDTDILDNGKVIVSWIDTAEEIARIMLSVFSVKGLPLNNYEIAKTDASRRSGFPIIEGVGDSVYVSWTDISGTPQVRLARLTFGLN